MNVLIDTPVWSLALRKQGKTPVEACTVSELTKLIREGRVVIVGPVRQELLSGISDEEKFEELRLKLRAFDDRELTTEDYELAASLSNECRRHGIQGSHTDFLLCAVSVRDQCAIFTLDRDFERYKGHVGIVLHEFRDARG